MVLMQPDTEQRVSLIAALDAVDAALAALPSNIDAYAVLTDTDLVFENGRHSRHRNALGAVGAYLAGQVAHRSAPELGSQGLARRSGYRTPEEFVKVTTRTTSREAVQAVKAGTLLVEVATEGDVNPVTGEIAVASQPWLKPVAVALADGHLSLAAADSIRAGLGVPNSSIGVDDLTIAAAALCVEARALDPDRLLRRAKDARAELDAAGVALREEERREQRSLKVFALPDGMGKLVWTMDPETFATVKDLYDRSTSPKLGGVRFSSGDAQAKMEAILADTRTPEQLGSDSFAHLLAAGSDADSSTLIGSGAPIIKLATSVATLEETMRAQAEVHAANAEGLEPEQGDLDTIAAARGYFETSLDAVSVATIQRYLCDGVAHEVIFDHEGQPMDAGREHRLFTRRQKAALAVRDGGCRWFGCERPPSWCEAHHILQWARDKGRTDTRNGILLCKHHHLLLHNNGWEIARDSDADGFDRYWLIPPQNVDPEQQWIPLPTKSRAIEQLRAEGAGVSRRC